MKITDDVKLPSIDSLGYETPLLPEEEGIQGAIHNFAKNIMRPIGRELDKMTAEEVIAPGSPFYQVYSEVAKLGLSNELIEQMPVDMAVRVESLIGEEMGWGDVGLAVSLVVTQFPGEMARALGRDDLQEVIAGKIGCWMITHPDKGSDVGAFDMQREWVVGQQGNKGSMYAKVGKDEIVINGQCSAWVSNGAVAQVALAYMSADYGDGFFDNNGRPYGATLIVPLDLPGVSRGKPLDKIGQRSLPQGEIYFDNVKIPSSFLLAGRDEYYGNVASAWSFAGTHMSQVFTGVARSAFEIALNYCHERKQGGQILMNHQLTRYRIGDMLRRVEICRSVARRTLAFARFGTQGHPWITASAKVTVTEEAEKVVLEAFRLLGGNATTREYPIEKLVRDVRSALIEDGENMLLTTRLGFLCQQMYENGWGQN